MKKFAVADDDFPLSAAWRESGAKCHAFRKVAAAMVLEVKVASTTVATTSTWKSRSEMQ